MSDYVAEDGHPEDDQPEDLPAEDVTPLASASKRMWTWAVRRVTTVTVWQCLFTAAVTAYTWYFTKVTLDVHHGLGTSSYDSALYDQGIWLMSRFKAPFVTLMGRNLMGDHASLILVLLVPLYWIWPSAGTLFFVQSLVIGLGALPIFLYVRKRLASEAMALLLACVYLLHPAVGLTNRENYHPDSFLAFFIGMTIYGALERKWRIYVVFAVLSALVKEDVLLVMAPIGVWVAFKRDRYIGASTVIASMIATMLGAFVMMKSLIGVPTRNAWRIPFGGPLGFLRRIIEYPGTVIDYLRADGRPMYVWQMTFPVAFAFVKRPAVAAISLLVITTNVISDFYYQHHIGYHYSLIAVPAIVLGTGYALGPLTRRWRRRMIGVVMVTAVWSCLMWGVIPLGKILTPWLTKPIGRPLPYYWPPSQPTAVAARQLFPLVPGGASVSAHYSLTPHLAHRAEIYQFPVPFRVLLYGPDTSLEVARACLPAVNDLEYVMLLADLPDELRVDWDKVKIDFAVVAKNEHFVLYRRAAHHVRCELSSGSRYPSLVVDG